MLHKSASPLNHRHKPLPRPIIRRLMPPIRIVKLRVMTTLPHQSIVIALFHYSATIKHDDTVGMADGGEAVRDQDGGAILQYQVKSFLNVCLGQWINTGGCFVQNDDRGVLQEYTRQCNQLTLSQRERSTGFSYERVQAIRQGIQPVTTANALGDRCDFFGSGIGTGIADIVGHTARKKEWRLWHNAQVTMVIA